MSDASFPFAGTTLDQAALTLGEGPTYDPVTETVWWFDILGKDLQELHLATGRKAVHRLPFMASVLARIDAGRQLLATEQGLYIRQTANGELEKLVAIETDRPGNRSNDGRVHPSGALWIGTMSKKAETGAGAIYHVAGTVVTKLFPDISIPNSICFAPDGATGYFVDSRANRLMRVALDTATGLPTERPDVLVDGTGMAGVFDGSVCDADGCIWNARWGDGAVDRYDPQGRHIARYAVPAKQVTCPAFIGKNCDRLMLTSAREGMEDAASPADGQTFELGIAVKGRPEPAFAL